MNKLICTGLLLAGLCVASAFDGMTLSGAASVWNTNQLRYTLDGSGSTNILYFTNGTSAYGDSNATHIKYVAASNKWLLATNGLAWIATNTFSAPTGTWKTLAAGTAFAQTRYQLRTANSISTTAPATPTSYNISADTSGNVTTPTNVFATTAEVETGTNDTKLLTPAGLAGAPLGAINVGVIYVDAVSGNDTTGAGTTRRPYATLTKAQTVATNGQMIYAARGTFTDNFLGKNGVSWYFEDGTYMVPGSQPLFFLSSITTNGTGCSNLVVKGSGTFTNTPVAVYHATNCTISFTAKDWLAPFASSVSLIYFYQGVPLSNFMSLRFQQVTGANAAGSPDWSQITNFNWLEVSGSEYLSLNATTAGAGHSNLFANLRAPRVYVGAAGFGGSLASVVVDAGLFSRFTPAGSAALNSLQSNYVWNVGIVTTNDLNTNIAGIWRGRVTVMRP
jgi:hypothetical protein